MWERTIGCKEEEDDEHEEDVPEELSCAAQCSSLSDMPSHTYLTPEQEHCLLLTNMSTMLST